MVRGRSGSSGSAIVLAAVIDLVAVVVGAVVWGAAGAIAASGLVLLVSAWRAFVGRRRARVTTRGRQLVARQAGIGALVAVGLIAVGGFGMARSQPEVPTAEAGPGGVITATPEPVVTEAEPVPDHSTEPAGDPAPDATAPAEVPTEDSQPVPVPVPEPEESVPAEPTTALELLETIEVKGRAPKTDYHREFQYGPAWYDVDSNGCDTRNDVLVRDLTDIVLDGDGCKVLTGVLQDPYTGERIDFVRGQDTSAEVQIDHVVALMDSWQKGAQRMTDIQRLTFANDPLNLLAVSGPANQQKGAGDAATWLPANRGYRCEYVARQVAVKAKYDLWMTGAEKEASRGILETCPDQPIPS